MARQNGKTFENGIMGTYIGIRKNTEPLTGRWKEGE